MKRFIKPALIFTAVLVVGAAGLVGIGQALVPHPNTGGGENPNNPFSVWEKPEDCAPYGTDLAVCDDASNSAAFDQQIKWSKAFRLMSRQFSANMMHQVYMVGTFFDSKQMLEEQRWMQAQQARAHKDYHPDEQICTISSFTKGLSAAENHQRISMGVLNKYILDREVNKKDTHTEKGKATEDWSLLPVYRSTYCNPENNNGELNSVCPAAPADTARIGRDINYTRLIDVASTINADFSSPRGTDEEMDNNADDILALSRLLYNDTPYQYTDKEQLLRNDGEIYYDTRSISAVRGIARDSFSKIVGMRLKGSDGALEYMRVFMQQFGLSEEHINAFMTDNPSYFTQMEIMSKKLFEHPDFYTALITKPANVRRNAVALEAIEVMNRRDVYENMLRREMLLSMIVEMKLRNLQENFVDPDAGRVSAP